MNFKNSEKAAHLLQSVLEYRWIYTREKKYQFLFIWLFKNQHYIGTLQDIRIKVNPALSDPLI